MASPSLLKTYRAVRELVRDIQETAAAVDEHLGRFQIYGTEEELAQAIARRESLVPKLQQLEWQLRRCARQAERSHGAGVESGEPVPVLPELSTASVS
jgi:hypothetical protein